MFKVMTVKLIRKVQHIESAEVGTARTCEKIIFSRTFKNTPTDSRVLKNKMFTLKNIQEQDFGDSYEPCLQVVVQFSQ